MFRFQGETEINIGGKTRPMCLCMNQLGEFTALYGGGFAVFDKFLQDIKEGNFNYTQYRDFWYTGLKWGLLKRNLPVSSDLTAINVGFWLEEVEHQEQIKFNNCFESALVKYQEDVKKKMGPELAKAA